MLKKAQAEPDYFELRARLTRELDRLPRAIANAQLEVEEMERGPELHPRMVSDKLREIELLNRALARSQRDLEVMDKRLRHECDGVYHLASGARTRALMAARELARSVLEPHVVPEVLDYVIGQSSYVVEEFNRQWSFPGPFSQDKNLPSWVPFVSELRLEAARCDARTAIFEAMRSGKTKLSAFLDQKLHPAAMAASRVQDPKRKSPGDLEAEERRKADRKNDGSVRRKMEQIVLKHGEGALLEAAQHDPEIRKRLRLV